MEGTKQSAYKGCSYIIRILIRASVQMLSHWYILSSSEYGQPDRSGKMLKIKAKQHFMRYAPSQRVYFYGRIATLFLTCFPLKTLGWALNLFTLRSRWAMSRSCKKHKPSSICLISLIVWSSDSPSPSVSSTHCSSPPAALEPMIYVKKLQMDWIDCAASDLNAKAAEFR